MECMSYGNPTSRRTVKQALAFSSDGHEYSAFANKSFFINKYRMNLRTKIIAFLKTILNIF